MKRLLWIGDGVTKTGFSTVNHNIIQNLSLEEYDIHHLAVNYHGDPHPYKWKIYPAFIKGDLLGFKRIPDFANMEFDGIFILNDPWVINNYLRLIKEHFKRIPPIIVYFPIDAKNHDRTWYENFDIVTHIVTYTDFGRQQLVDIDIDNSLVIPHGLDHTTYFKIQKDEAKKLVYPNKDEFLNSFIVLNANRNQPRKRTDLTIETFKLFSENKPENVKLYMHMGLKDVGWDIPRLVDRFGIAGRLIVSGTDLGPQQVPESRLNLIYNATDVGINTGIGEGWGLVQMEHAVTGAPQVVGDHSSLRELYYDCGLLVPTIMNYTNVEILTTGRVSKPEDFADKLEDLYQNKSLYDELSKRSVTKFSDKKFSWEYIVNNSWIPLFKETYG